MRITEILKKELINPDLASRNKKEVIYELVNILSSHEKNIKPERLVEVLLHREKLGSTGIGDGVAIPHGKLSDVNHLVACFGRSKRGINFEALDGKASHLFFLLVAPENSAGAHLKALARISRLFKDRTFRENLMEAKDQEEIYKIIAEEDSKY